MNITKDHIQIEIFRNAWNKPRGDYKNKWFNNESKNNSFKSFQGGNELHIVMEDLKVLYDNFKKDYESLEETIGINYERSIDKIKILTINK